MKSFHKTRTFRRTLLVTMMAMSTSGCFLDDDDEDPVVEPPVETNTAPSITSTSVDASTEGTAYAYTLAATDADGDALTMSATTLPAWLMFDAATGALTGTPATTDVGMHEVVLSVTDGTAPAVTQSFTITVAAVVVPNAAPVVTSTSVDAATEGVVYAYTFTATDADQDTLTMSATTLPSWLTFDAATGILTGTPATANVGANPVVLSVTDGEDAQEQSFTITVAAAVVVNTAPTITSTGVTTGTVGVEYSYTLTATDAQGDTLSMSSVTLPTWGAFDTATGILSGTPDMADDYDVELMVSDGTDATNQTFTIAVADATAMTVELVVFEDAALPGWVAWTDNGGPTELVTDDVAHDQTTRFTLTKPSVAGFSARASEGPDGTPYDASGIVSTGMVSFELKMLEAPTAGVVDWKLKIESSVAANAVEVNLSTATEGHATPVKDVWQTYTFPLSVLDAAGTMDFADIALFMVFPNYGDATGADFLLDNFMIVNDPNGGGNNGGDGELGPELLTNGDFESGNDPWINAVNIELDGANNVFVADVQATGNPWDVNLSQVLGLTEGATYELSFKAKASVARSMRAGLGQNFDPFNSVYNEPALTTDWNTFTYDIVATGIGSADNSRVLFDMGAELGVINIDDVSLKLKGADNGGGGNSGASTSGGDLIVDVTAGIDFEGTEAQQANWEAFENGSNPALEFVANPSMVGNTSAQVAKLNLETAEAGNGKFAGAVTRTVQEFALSADTAIVKIWVYKDKISPVGVKFERKRGDGYGSHGELTVSNTQINQWEQLTIDFTAEIGRPENEAISGIAIFPDMVDGRTETVVYFDEITFTSN